MRTQTPILLADIRKGDLVRKEYDEGTQTYATAVEYVATGGEETYGPLSGAYFLLDRPVPPVVLPDVPGIYVSWVNPPSPTIVHKITDGRWVDAEDLHYLSESVVSTLLPLTRLEPVADTAKRVLAEVRGLFGPGALMLNEVDEIAARWAAK